jgi:PhzF family phenazine biosynthesis protein
MTAAGLTYFVIDAFTDRPFAGNPAAVVPLDAWRPDAWLQQVAQEMNLSETSFLVPQAGGYELRWFTPKVEVDLCGHATLAAGVALAQLGKLADGQTLSFATRSGTLTVSRSGARYDLDFPVKPEQQAEAPSGLLAALGVAARYVGRNQFDFLIEVENESVLRKVAPDFKQLSTVRCRGVIVTAASDEPRYDFVSRFFAPAAGIDEDPVTGSAHCCLADFWGRRLGKTTLDGYQASARGGIVHVERRGERVILGGQGVVIARGELLVG